VVSDWGAVYHPGKAVMCGNDLRMPGPIDPKDLLKELEVGGVTEEAIDKAVNNYLKVLFRLEEKKKAFGEVSLTTDEVIAFTDEIANQAAKEGIVLLKNNGMFPFVAGESSPILITGSGSRNILTCGTGSAGITTNRNTRFDDEMIKLFGDRVRVMESSTDSSKAPLVAGSNVLIVASIIGMEGDDRVDLKLSDYDRQVIKQYTDAKKQGLNIKIGLILNVSGPVEIAEYEEDLDGIFCIFLPGMQGAKVLADMIVGNVNPSGKLPLSFPKRYEDCPTALEFPGDGYQTTYGENIYVGYRYYDKKKLAPLYAFGYGLSYTTFKLDDFKASEKRTEGMLTISGKITNTGSMEGKEVVQLYISDVTASVHKPVKELKKFVKVSLLPGEEKEITFELNKQDFAYFDMDYDGWISEEGYYDIYIGTSSRYEDIKLVDRIYLEGKSPYSYGLNSTIKTFYETVELKNALMEFVRKEGFDKGLFDSSYQYVNNRTIVELLETVSGISLKELSDEKRDACLMDKYGSYKEFSEKLSIVEKP